MAYIGVQPTDTYLSIASQQITGTGSATYTLDYSVSNEEDVAVFVNNVRQNVSTYTVSGTSLTLGGTISASDSCWILFLGRTVGTKTPAVGSVTNDMLSGSIATSKLANQNIGFRNLIINGDMSIAQRGTSSTSQTSAGYKTCDRFRISINTLGTWTITQDSDTPSNQGFGYSLKLQCTTADASPVSGDDLYIQHKIEGQNLTQLKYGGSGAESLTLSFWVKSNKTGTASLNFLQRDNSAKLYTTTYSISSANTWEKKTITISGDTSGVINNDSGSGFEILWWLNSGSLYTSGTTRNAWTTYADGDSNVSNLGLGGSTSDYINITGVQLEVGTSASDFEFIPYDVNLQRCLRYYFLKASGSSQDIGIATYYSGTDFRTSIPFPVSMRTTPSIDVASVTDGYQVRRAGGFDNVNSFSSNNYSLSSAGILNNTEANGTSGQAGHLFTNNASCFLAFDAEL